MHANCSTKNCAAVPRAGQHAWLLLWCSALSDPVVSRCCCLRTRSAAWHPDPDCLSLSRSSDGAKPGLAKLYLTAMDGIEGVTPKDALYLLQGSAVSYYWATDAGGGLNAYGLSPGELPTANSCS